LHGASPLCIDFRQDGFADAVVTETHAAVDAAFCYQNTFFEGRCEKPFHDVGRFATGDSEHRQLGASTQRRHHLDDFTRARRDGRQPGHRADRQVRLTQQRPHGQLVPAPPSRGRHQDALLTQPVE
jgi:hypothetical protein